MDLFQAIVLGIVEGISEYLPISSTGHLILASRMLGIVDDPASRAYLVVIQGGAILAVLSLFLPRVKQIFAGLVGRDPEGFALGLKLIVAFVPAAIAGLLFEDTIDRVLFGLWPVVLAWAIGGAAILAFSPLRNGRPGQHGTRLESLTFRGALVIGIFQCLALVPGTSRSLATIAGGLFLGLSSAAAVEFSLLLGVMTLTAAAGHKLMSHGAAITHELGTQSLVVGILVSFVSAWLAVRWLVGFLRSRGLMVFGFYRLALALAVALYLGTHVIAAG